ncbi:MAG: 16S rRNA (cytosine(1402)-N(4))-methyltransferase RsmH [Deinococcales bacterium]
MIQSLHSPVMLERCLEELALDPASEFYYVDATFGAGGHTRAMLSRGVKVIAIDQDKRAEGLASDLIEKREFRFIKGNFRDLEHHLRRSQIRQVAGILLDLGVSSMQLDEAERGFAFRQNGPLDMRMDESNQLSAMEVVNQFSQEKLAWLIFKYGEDRYSRRISRAIVEARTLQPIQTTMQLVDIIVEAYPRGPRNEHPARRTFQALRILVNDELGALVDVLNAADKLLIPKGRLVVLSYHSLEDRIVKEHLQQSKQLKAVYKKPLEASEEEVRENPRARSAKMRVAERLEPPQS